MPLPLPLYAIHFCIVISSVIYISAFQKVPSCSERKQVVIERHRASRSEKVQKLANSKGDSGAVGAALSLLASEFCSVSRLSRMKRV